VTTPPATTPPCSEGLGKPSSFKVARVELSLSAPKYVLNAAAQTVTRGTGSQTIENKLVVDPVPVQSSPSAKLNFNTTQNLSYHALLYEVQDAQGSPVSLSPNWFGVAIPDLANFDLSGDVYVILYFHPTPQQSGALFNNADYQNKDGASGGTDWKQLFAFVDRLGGQATAALKKDKAPPNNRLIIFPFLESPFAQPFSLTQPYNLPTSEWVNIIHDILQDISATFISELCTRPKKVVVAGLSNGSVYLDVFLDKSQPDATSTSIFPNIVEVWDFDSDVITAGQRQVEAHGIHERAYWQKRRDATIPQGADFIQVPPPRWTKFPNPPPDELPPLPPHPSNTNPNNNVPDPAIPHHYIRDTMFLDAVWNLANPNK
jgi:hypothetical protein